MTQSLISTQPLAFHDLQWCLRRAPRQLLEQMKAMGPGLMVAGGFVRSCVANEPINDIDCFCPSKAIAAGIAYGMVDGDPKRVWESENAYTVKGFSSPIQLIHRWTFNTPADAILSFDFTIARAAFWYSIQSNSWQSIADSRFYQDLAGKRLIYTNPIRNEDAGGSLLRVLKFYQRGYRIPLDSYGAVLARLIQGLEVSKVVHGGAGYVSERAKFDEFQVAKVLTGLLREVDPNVDPSHVAHLPSESDERTADLAEAAA
jgi:hypothetical protein